MPVNGRAEVIQCRREGLRGRSPAGADSAEGRVCIIMYSFACAEGLRDGCKIQVFEWFSTNMYSTKLSPDGLYVGIMIVARRPSFQVWARDRILRCSRGSGRPRERPRKVSRRFTTVKPRTRVHTERSTAKHERTTTINRPRWWRRSRGGCVETANEFYEFWSEEKLSESRK